jgi:hypothetical protein
MPAGLSRVISGVKKNWAADVQKQKIKIKKASGKIDNSKE